MKLVKSNQLFNVNLITTWLNHRLFYFKIEFSRIAQSWHFCTTSNENKLEVVVNKINCSGKFHEGAL